MIQTQLIYCGDNLQKLRELPDECVDLIYIDPPFNSGRTYEQFWGDAKEKRSFEDRFGDVEHYIHWMRPRVMELYRVLKKSGSFYYHCDWHADAYVRMMLDQQFGHAGFRSHIVWQRTAAKGLSSRSFPNNHDSIFLYAKSDANTWNGDALITSYDLDDLDAKTDEKYSLRESDGRRYQLTSLLNPAHDRPNLTYEFLGVTRVWRWTRERMQEAYDAGLVVQPSKGAVPRFKRYLDEQRGRIIGDVWTDIPPINSRAKERLGYPTQKPLALLDRIIKASSNKGDLVLDAFCGCGTALEAAQHLGRRWIGIDISPTSCRVMAQRLKDRAFLKEGTDFWVRDLPKTAEELRKYPPFEFENWAVNALNTVIANGHAIANRAQVGDMGIDGRIYPATHVKEKQAGYNLFGESDSWFPVQVKQKDKAGRPDIDSFETAMQRQGRNKGFFISFDFTSDALKEIKRAMREMSLEIIPITVTEILDEEVQYRV